MLFRDMTARDVPATFAVRTATKENPFSRDALARHGITEASVRLMLKEAHRGWVCEVGGELVGFAMGDGRTGELWVIAVLPGHEGKGIGAQLLKRVEDWLWSLGWAELWLWTSPDPTLRAYQLYLRHGWAKAEMKEGRLFMRKPRPA